MKIFDNHSYRLFIIIFLFSFISLSKIHCFDYNFYVNKYSDAPKDEIETFYHYLNYGFYHNRECAPLIENTNFDWNYYAENNNLDIKTKVEAINHYKNVGRKQNLSFCNKFKVAIIVHLYDLNLMEEFIEKINYFIKINQLNEFYIKINIPIGANIHLYKGELNSWLFEDISYFNHILNLTPYHKYLINANNYPILSSLSHKLKNAFEVNSDKVQIMFSENRGADIGGFLLSIDQMFKQNLNVDYIVKVHTKNKNSWRQVLTSILNLRINKLLNEYEYVHNCYINVFKVHPILINLMKTSILKNFNIECTKPFGHSSGTMFIASSKLLDIFKNYNLLTLFNNLNPNDDFHNPAINTGLKMEHQYELFFGCLASELNLKHKIIGYIKRDEDALNIKE